MTEWELIQRCREGKTSAFEPLVRAHEGPALGYAAAMLGDADEAADALQDAFVQAYRGLARLRPNSPFGPWFRTIVRNTCLDRLRSPRLRQRTALTAAALDERTWTEPTAVRSTESMGLTKHLAAALAELPDEQRVTILLREVEGLSYAEIATTLGVPSGTVASRLNHARAALRERLVARGLGPEDLS
ncbi:MAG TPA: RNA polymerase sigma factor [Longimicrobiales bacterium]|nr:RNA polymerase sigma factor [Longimicrobiales bacterium]